MESEWTGAKVPSMTLKNQVDCMVIPAEAPRSREQGSLPRNGNRKSTAPDSSREHRTAGGTAGHPSSPGFLCRIPRSGSSLSMDASVQHFQLLLHPVLLGFQPPSDIPSPLTLQLNIDPCLNEHHAVSRLDHAILATCRVLPISSTYPPSVMILQNPSNRAEIPFGFLPIPPHSPLSRQMTGS